MSRSLFSLPIGNNSAEGRGGVVKQGFGSKP